MPEHDVVGHWRVGGGHVVAVPAVGDEGGRVHVVDGAAPPAHGHAGPQVVHENAHGQVVAITLAKSLLLKAGKNVITSLGPMNWKIVG